MRTLCYSYGETLMLKYKSGFKKAESNTKPLTTGQQRKNKKAK